MPTVETKARTMPERPYEGPLHGDRTCSDDSSTGFGNLAPVRGLTE